MLLEGCQGKRGPSIREKECPFCGNTVELMSTDLCVTCEECGGKVYSDLMDCVFRCPAAKECVGEAQYARFAAARGEWEARMRKALDEDAW